MSTHWWLLILWLCITGSFVLGIWMDAQVHKAPIREEPEKPPITPATRLDHTQTPPGGF